MLPLQLRNSVYIPYYRDSERRFAPALALSLSPKAIGDHGEKRKKRYK